MRFVIVTGMSGAGKSSALKILEDFGFFCVDNLPIKLIDTFADLTFNPTSCTLSATRRARAGRGRRATADSASRRG